MEYKYSETIVYVELITQLIYAITYMMMCVCVAFVKSAKSLSAN